MAENDRRTNADKHRALAADGYVALLARLREQIEEDVSAEKRAARDAEARERERARQQVDLLRFLSLLSAPKAGIEYHIDGAWVHAPLGADDQAILQRCVLPQPGESKLAIGLPRVPTGISTWLAVATMAARLVMSVARAAQVDRIPPSGMPPATVIASRDRGVRELYLHERLRFGNRPFSVKDFPVYRIRRDGQIVSLVPNASPNEMSTPVVFYHFEALDEADVDVHLMLAEIAEGDARASGPMLERLERVRCAVGDPATVVFFNSFDDRLRGALAKQGYAIRHALPQPVQEVTGVQVPTLASVFARFAYRRRILPDVVNDPSGISDALLEAATALAQVGEHVETNDGRLALSRWWGMWRTMKDLAIPLDLYERYRTRVQGRGSLEHATKQAARAADRIAGREGALLRQVAPTIGGRLGAVYNLLGSGNPKAEKLHAWLRAVADRPGVAVMHVLTERGQVSALRENLLFNEPELLEALSPITYLARAAETAYGRTPDCAILSGVWAPWHEPNIVALGTPDLIVLAYPYEASLLLTRVEGHATECRALASARLNGEGGYPPILLLSRQDEDHLTSLASRQPPAMEAAERQHRYETLNEADIQDEYAQDEPAVDELEARVLVTFDDGTFVAIAQGAEFMRICEDEGVETVRAEDLRSGDRVAVVRGAAARSLFDTVLARVNHLVRADPKVIEQWRSAVDSVRSGSATGGKPPSARELARRLRAAGCQRGEQAIRSWFVGTTLAPFDPEDIRRILELAGVARAREMAPVVAREVQLIRTFNQRLGIRIHAQIRAIASGEEVPAADRLAIEIDEALEAVEYKTVLNLRVRSEEGTPSE